jgi:hypothetical protein
MKPRNSEAIASLLVSGELHGFTHSMTELHWLLLILVMLYFHIPTRPIDNPDGLVAVMVSFAGFVLPFRYLAWPRREARRKHTVQMPGMTACITRVLYDTGRSQSPPLNLYLFVIIACAMTLCRMMTLPQVLQHAVRQS